MPLRALLQAEQIQQLAPPGLRTALRRHGAAGPNPDLHVWRGDGFGAFFRHVFELFWDVAQGPQLNGGPRDKTQKPSARRPPVMQAWVALMEEGHHEI